MFDYIYVSVVLDGLSTEVGQLMIGSGEAECIMVMRLHNIASKYSRGV